MTETLKFYEALRQALKERQEAIADRNHFRTDPEGHLERLKQVSLKIFALTNAFEGPLDPQFQHYLERCSYDKALDWLEEACSKAE
ncbi:MAG: hypothetical protein ABI615_12370 [Chthoniobacterales bacterium]